MLHVREALAAQVATLAKDELSSMMATLSPDAEVLSVRAHLDPGLFRPDSLEDSCLKTSPYSLSSTADCTDATVEDSAAKIRALFHRKRKALIDHGEEDDLLGWSYR